jgi:hypothetical protein
MTWLSSPVTEKSSRLTSSSSQVCEACCVVLFGGGCSSSGLLFLMEFSSTLHEQLNYLLQLVYLIPGLARRLTGIKPGKLHNCWRMTSIPPPLSLSLLQRESTRNAATEPIAETKPSLRAIRV